MAPCWFRKCGSMAKSREELLEVCPMWGMWVKEGGDKGPAGKRREQ